MSAFALTLVLAAAMLHATWNALVKGAQDRALSLAGVATMHTIVGAGLIAYAGIPAPESWPPLAISGIVHIFYFILLFQAYRVGDLSQIYPMSRGMAPLLAGIGTFLIIGENLSPLGWSGLVAVSIGIGLLAFRRGVPGNNAVLVVGTLLGLTIACYSVADGIGVRYSQNTLAYIGWISFLEIPVAVTVLTARLRSPNPFDKRVFAIGLAGGACSVIAYGVVLYVQTFAPIAAVSAVRESSVIFAALIGILIFGERPWAKRLLAAAIVALGVTALAIG